MALDHYVSQVHLRKFYAEATDFRKMFAYRKSDGAQFMCGSEDVCRIEQGSTNSFLTEPRILEDFLMRVEPHYNGACDAMLANKFGIDGVLVIAGFASFVIGASPTAMRIGARSLELLAHTEIELLDRASRLDRAPPELGGKTATELIQDGLIMVEADHKYPQAMGISEIENMTKSFATFHWEILLNSQSGQFPFLTSDYPAAIEGLGRQIPANRFIPLQPNLAVRILPQIRPKGYHDKVENFRYKVRSVSPHEVRKVNLAVARCAENLVFAPARASWVERLVKKNARFRIELEHTRVPKGTGYMLLNSMVVKTQ